MLFACLPETSRNLEQPPPRAAREHRQPLALWWKQTQHFRRKVRLLGLLALLFLTCFLLSQGLTTTVSRRQANPLLAAEMKNMGRQSVAGRGWEDCHSFPLFWEDAPGLQGLRI